MRHYWKYVYETWVQPVLTSNTSYGYVHSEDGEQDGWYMYDGTTNNDFNTYTKPNLLMWDLPDDIKVTAVDFYNCWSGGNQTTRQIKLYADNDRLKPLTDVINVNGGSRALTHIDIPVENQQFSKHFSVDFVASNYQIVGSSLTNITAQKRTAVEATPDDYDFYTDDDVITCIKRAVKHYWKYLYSSYTLPVMTSDTSPSGKVNSNFNTGEYTTAPYKLFFNQNEWHYDNWANRGDDKYNEYVFPDFLKEGTYTLSFTAYRQANPTTPEYRFIIKYIDDTEYTVYTLTNLTTTATVYSQTFTATKPIKSIKVYMPTVSASSSNSIMTYFKYFKIENTNGLEIHTGTTPTTLYNHDHSTDGYKLLFPTKIVRNYWYRKHILDVFSVGSPTITDGIVSNITSADYVQMPTPFVIQGNNTWDVIFKVKRTAEQYSAVVGTDTYAYNSTRLAIDATGKMVMYWGYYEYDYAAFTGNFQIPLNEWYYVRYTFDATTATLSYSTDGVNWTVDATKELSGYPGSTQGSGNNMARIGWTDQQYGWGDFPFAGEIDLNESSIIFNGVRINDIEYNIPATKDDYDFYTDDLVYYGIKQ